MREVVRASKRQILELLATERALAAEAWLREVKGVRLQVARESRLSTMPREHESIRVSSRSASQPLRGRV